MNNIEIKHLRKEGMGMHPNPESVPTQLVGLPDFGQLLSVDEFIAMVQSNALIDYDGDGCWATPEGMDDTITIKPSAVHRGMAVPPLWATNVMWFNR